MSKSILVIDTPDKCWKCSCCGSYQSSAFSEREYWCCAMDKDVDANTKPDWCPLKELSDKKDVYWLADNAGWSSGYNACIDDILGGQQ